MRCLYNGEHPCGKCPACLANRQRAFCFRLDQEKEKCSFYFWLTLQYDNDHVPRFPDGEMCFSKEHCRLFFEKIRKKYDHKVKSERHYKFKHFLVSEYGPNGTRRPHYHCLFMVYSDLPLAKLYHVRKEMRDYIVNDAWEYGHVTEKPFHGRTISYLTKYCCKPELTGDYHTMKPFTLISRGIGLGYLDTLTSVQIKNMIENLDFTVRYGNSKIQLPRYYVDKIVPHSKALLNSKIPVGHEEDPEAWLDYQKISDLRKRFADRQSEMSLHQARLSDMQEQNIEEIRSSIDAHQQSIVSEMTYFRAKIRKRKDF